MWRSLTTRFINRVRSPLTKAEIDALEQVPQPPPADVLEMLRRLGGAMCDGGDATDYIAEHLERIAGAYGAHQVSFFALPTGVFVRIDLGPSTGADFAPATGRNLRLDQIGALYDLVHLAEKAHIAPREALRRLDEILVSRPRFRWRYRIVGLIALTVGLGMVLNPSVQALPAYVALALVVAAVEALATRLPVLGIALPVVTAFVVTFASYKLAGPLFDEDPTKVLIPALVTFLPGAALTIGTVELSMGSMISGSSRLVYGLERLLLLAFGISAGAAFAGTFQTPASPTDQLGWWAPLVGITVFGIGHYVHSPAPRRSLIWLLLILYAAYAAQLAGAELWGAVASGFTGALVVPPLARWVESRRNGPPGWSRSCLRSGCSFQARSGWPESARSSGLTRPQTSATSPMPS